MVSRGDKVAEVITLTQHSMYKLLEGSSTDKPNLSVHGAWLEGAADMSLFMLAALGGPKEGFGDGSTDKAFRLIRLLTLKMGYVFLRANTYEVNELKGVYREQFIREKTKALFDCFWDTSEERGKAFEELMVLESQFNIDNDAREAGETSNVEHDLIYSKTLAICSGREIDLSGLEPPIDRMDFISSGLASMPLAERPLGRQAEMTGYEGIMRVLGGAWPYEGNNPLSTGGTSRSSQPYAGSNKSSSGGCLIYVGVFGVSILCASYAINAIL